MRVYLSSLVVAGVLLGMAPVCLGLVTVRAYLPEPNTPLAWAEPNTPHVYRDIMVGTQVSLVAASDVGGTDAMLGFVIPGSLAGQGILKARGFSEETHDWAGSRLAAAGPLSVVWDLVLQLPDGGFAEGFQCSVIDQCTAGDWFVLDYQALAPGRCEVQFHDSLGFDAPSPVRTYVFNQVPTRDFDQDRMVDFNDFAVLAQSWGSLLDLNDPNREKGPQEARLRSDLNHDRTIDVRDLRALMEYWLARTRPEANDPNTGLPTVLFGPR